MVPVSSSGCRRGLRGGGKRWHASFERDESAAGSAYRLLITYGQGATIFESEVVVAALQPPQLANRAGVMPLSCGSGWDQGKSGWS